MIKGKSPTLLFWILTSMILGIFAGFFFGEWCEHLEFVGRTFIAVMQISVLPYILVSLIRSIGRLEPGSASSFARRGMIMIAILWGITFMLMTLMPLTFPHWRFSAFFSPHILDTGDSVDYIYLFIPSNPFNAMANNIVPAVAIFSILCGVILMGTPNKEKLLEPLDTMTEVLSRLNLFLVRLSPIGIFALVANAAGTMRLEEVGHLEIYLTSYLVMGLLLFFVILPLLLCAFTPFRYIEILKTGRTTMLTVLLTGSLFIVLPLLVDNIEDLFRRHQLKGKNNENIIKIIVPIIFILPCSGRLLDILFILFAGWYNHVVFGVAEYVKLYAAGLLTSFGRPAADVPHLLLLLKLPADMTELFHISSFVTDNIRLSVEAFTVFVFSIFFVAWMDGAVHLKLQRFVYRLVLIGGITAAALIGLGWFFRSIPEPESKRSIIDAMKLTPRMEFQVFDRLPETSFPDEDSHLDRIFRTRTLRVGFNPETMPFAFFNSAGELVGFDIAMVDLLAEELGCKKIEFYPVDLNHLERPLNANQVDIIVGEVSVNEERLGKMAFTDHYLELSLGLLVPDYQKARLQKNPALLAQMTVAALRGTDFHHLLEVFPECKPVELTAYDDFFSGKVKADALLTSAEDGSIRTILHPEYDVYISPSHQHRDLIAYAIANGDTRFLDYLKFWLTLKKLNGEIDRQYEYWIKGVNVKPRPRRWSILHDVILGAPAAKPE